jgi:transcription-repair coupling factor (superfamily II helicase)
MYVKLLDQTIRELKGEELEDERRAAVNLRLDLRIDDAYVPDMNQRLTIYRRLASVRQPEEVTRLLDELRDRYGTPPGSVEHLAQYAQIRLLADRIGLESVDREGEHIVVKFRPDARVDPVPLARLVGSRADLTLLPPAILRIDLSRPDSSGGRASEPRLAASKRTAQPEGEDASWWTARATSSVAPGFTREQVLARPSVSPDRPGGLFERLTGVLDELSRSMVAG